MAKRKSPAARAALEARIAELELIAAGLIHKITLHEACIVELQEALAQAEDALDEDSFVILDDFADPIDSGAGPTPASAGRLAEAATGKASGAWEPAKGAALVGERAELLREAGRLWPGSMASLEKAAGLPRGFISSARRGRRSSENSDAHWRVLASAVARLRRERAA